MKKGVFRSLTGFDGGSGMICVYTCVVCIDAIRNVGQNICIPLTIDATRLTLLLVHVVLFVGFVKSREAKTPDVVST